MRYYTISREEAIEKGLLRPDTICCNECGRDITGKYAKIGSKNFCVDCIDWYDMREPWDYDLD